MLIYSLVVCCFQLCLCAQAQCAHALCFVHTCERGHLIDAVRPARPLYPVILVAWIHVHRFRAQLNVAGMSAGKQKHVASRSTHSCQPFALGDDLLQMICLRIECRSTGQSSMTRARPSRLRLHSKPCVSWRRNRACTSCNTASRVKPFQGDSIVISVFSESLSDKEQSRLPLHIAKQSFLIAKHAC